MDAEEFGILAAIGEVVRTEMRVERIVRSRCLRFKEGARAQSPKTRAKISSTRLRW